MKFDELIKKKKGIEKIALIIGMLCFIVIVVLVIITLGFSMEIHRNINTKNALSLELSLGLSLLLGLVGGVLLDYKHIFISAVLGAICGISLYLTTDLYLKWRDEFLMIEIIVPILIISILGVKLHQIILTKINSI